MASTFSEGLEAISTLDHIILHLFWPVIPATLLELQAGQTWTRIIPPRLLFKLPSDWPSVVMIQLIEPVLKFNLWLVSLISMHELSPTTV